MKKVSNHNTKAEIIEAYNELLDILKSEREENTSLKKELEQKQKTVQKVSAETKDSKQTSIKALKDLVIAQLDGLETSMETERKKFEELQEAISIEKENLKELYKIKTEAESLEALVATNKKAKEAFEEQAEAQKEALEQEIKEKKLAWQREQEEYNYKLKIERRNETDAYQQKKMALEKELKEKKTAFEHESATREKVLAEKETEFDSLKKQVDGFDKLLASQVAATEKQVTERLTKEFEYNQKLETKDLEAKIGLQAQEITALKNKIKEQQDFIDSLSGKSDSAIQQVRDIALKAIENAGSRPVVPQYVERGKEEKG